MYIHVAFSFESSGQKSQASHKLKHLSTLKMLKLTLIFGYNVTSFPLLRQWLRESERQHTSQWMASLECLQHPHTHHREQFAGQEVMNYERHTHTRMSARAANPLKLHCLTWPSWSQSSIMTHWTVSSGQVDNYITASFSYLYRCTCMYMYIIHFTGHTQYKHIWTSGTISIASVKHCKAIVYTCKQL